MQIITAAVIKGGTGKTTATAALAQAAAEDGQRVLAIDLDPQANLSFTLGAQISEASSYQLLHGADAAGLIQTTAQGLDVIPASPDLATEKTTAGSAVRLRNAIEKLKRKYDFIFIDTPPTMGELTYNALIASTGVIIPLNADNYSLQGLYQLTDIAAQLKQTSPKMAILGVILSSYDGRAKISRYMADAIKENAEAAGVPFLGAVRSGVVIREAQALQKSLYKYARNSKPAQDYKEIYDKIKGGKRR